MCRSNGTAIALAVHNAMVAHGQFPYSMTRRNGHRHSWRVVVGQYIESPAKWSYDFDSAWNSPVNVRAEVHIPTAYRCDARRDILPPHSTTWVAITGPNCVLRDDSYPPRQVERLDPDTVMIVETTRNEVHWMSPEDLEYADLIADPEYARRVIGGSHPGGGHYITVDGYIGRIDDIGVPELLRRCYVPDRPRAGAGA